MAAINSCNPGLTVLTVRLIGRAPVLMRLQFILYFGHHSLSYRRYRSNLVLNIINTNVKILYNFLSHLLYKIRVLTIIQIFALLVEIVLTGAYVSHWPGLMAIDAHYPQLTWLFFFNEFFVFFWIRQGE